MAHAAAAARPDGLVLGRYRPLRPLGSGGSGSVWLARDEVNGLDVALKIIPREGKAAARAEREAEAAARLRHARCLRVHALAHDDGHVYIAYEYVPGRTLREALRSGELDDARAVEAAAQMLEGLAHAHGHGVVHRDVKPSNVLLAEGEELSARLLDFGLARLEEAETLTAVGDVPGTLAYIAPERLAGDAGTAASDVWAVGVFLWEALAGRHPFWYGSLLESARAIEAGAPPLQSERPDLPKPLLAAVDAALSLDPARRPTAARLADLLRSSARVRKPRQLPRPSLALPRVPTRVVPACLAALATGWTTATLPFFPRGWPLLLAAAAGAAALARPRLGLAVALAAPVLPLGNLSLGLAILYGVVACAWLALFYREPLGGLLPALGPLLAPLAALGLLPLAMLAVRSPLKRALAASSGVLLAVLAAGVRGAPLPLTGAPAPGTLPVARVEDPGAVAAAVAEPLLERPDLLVGAAVLGLAAAVLPYARVRGTWALAAWGAALLGAALLASPAIGALPLIACTWAICAILALRPSG
jgi:hypothetical protein